MPSTTRCCRSFPGCGRRCSPEATFFDPHVTHGMVAALEPIALRCRMPFSDVMRMALLGPHERMTAERALATGLVTEIVERPSLLARAHELAGVIAGQPAAPVQGTVKALWQSLDLTRAQSLATALMYTQVGDPLGTADLTVPPSSGRNHGDDESRDAVTRDRRRRVPHRAAHLAERTPT